jgi:SAM-dependent methyltransferase
MRETFEGRCPICGTRQEFVSDDTWYRDYLNCRGCWTSGGSVPRERAAAWAIALLVPRLATARVHEVAPSGNAFTQWLQRNSATYTASNYFPERPFGDELQGLRNEDIQAQTFGEGVFDLVVSLDVYEHIDDPGAASREIARTLTPAGLHIFTAPTYKDLARGERRARLVDGTVEHLAEPEYHGNPISDEGSLVFHHYGYDLPSLIRDWTGLDTIVLRAAAPGIGVLGEHTEVYCTGRLALWESAGTLRAPNRVRSLARRASTRLRTR